MVIAEVEGCLPAAQRCRSRRVTAQHRLTRGKCSIQATDNGLTRSGQAGIVIVARVPLTRHEP
jgi:hypothetical protein